VTAGCHGHLGWIEWPCFLLSLFFKALQAILWVTVGGTLGKIGVSLDDYEALVAAARKDFKSRRSVSVIFSPGVSKGLLENFLLFFCAYGVRITEPVEGWIRQAGERCIKLGFGRLGESLLVHSKQEAGHHLLFLQDAKSLAARADATHRIGLDLAAILAMPDTPGIDAYRELHKRVIEGDSPYAQIAIEYEIEALSIEYGPRLIGQVINRLGQETAQGLSFIKHHVAADVGHTSFNQRQIENLLAFHPQAINKLAYAGKAALAAYGIFLDDCLELAGTQRAEAV